MIDIQKIEKGTEVLNRLGQTGRVVWIKHRKWRGGKTHTTIHVNYGGTNEGEGSPEDFFEMPGVSPRA